MPIFAIFWRIDACHLKSSILNRTSVIASRTGARRQGRARTSPLAMTKSGSLYGSEF